MEAEKSMIGLSEELSRLTRDHTLKVVLQGASLFSFPNELKEDKSQLFVLKCLPAEGRDKERWILKVS